jgi:hypothetical protein
MARKKMLLCSIEDCDSASYFGKCRTMSCFLELAMMITDVSSYHMLLSLCSRIAYAIIILGGTRSAARLR